MAKTKRKAISVKTRFDIFKRDGFSCQYCGSHPPQVLLEVDHIVAVAGGGGGDLDNLITACVPCNRGKGARALTDIPVSLKEQAKEIAEREEQLRGYHDVMEAKRQRLDEQMWDVAHVYMDQFNRDSMRRDYLTSIKMFVDKLGYHECLESMEVALSRMPTWSEDKAFRYFCGTCWGKIRDKE